MSDAGKGASAPMIPVDTSAPEVRAAMDTARQAEEEVKSWPAWKRGDAPAPPTVEKCRLQTCTEVDDGRDGKNYITRLCALEGGHAGPCEFTVTVSVGPEPMLWTGARPPETPPSVGVTPSSAPTTGVKHDAGKLRWSLLPWNALRVIVEVLEFGARKYATDAWRRVPDAKRRYTDAMLRHVVSYAQGERTDPESKLPTLGHVGCCVLFLLWFDLQDEKA